MIYIRECKYCGREDIVPNCLRGLDLCGNCVCNPRRVALQGHSKDGVAPPPSPPQSSLLGEAPGRRGPRRPLLTRIETLVNIHNLRKNNTCFDGGLLE